MISRVDGHLLFGPKGARAAIFRVDTISYPHMGDGEKRDWHDRLAQFAYTIEADFSLYRVNRAYPADRYVAQAMDCLDAAHQDPEVWREYLQSHEQHLATLGAFEPEVYLVIRLPIRRKAGDQEATRLDAERVQHRAVAYLPLRPATVRELQWLFRRAATRGVCEPVLDEHWHGGDHRLEPVAATMRRVRAEAITEDKRVLVVDADEAQSYQAMLTVGALPEASRFPGGSEFLFTPLESVPFPADVVMHCRWQSNRQSIEKVRRKITEADVIFEDAATGRSGIRDVRLDENRQLGRELQADLNQPSRPPTLLTTISLAVGAPDRETLEARVDQLRRAFGTIRLHRPFGHQAALYEDHLPRTDGGKVRGWEDRLMVLQADGGSQFGSLMPIGTHVAGTERGPFFARVTAGTNRPIRLDITEAPRASRPPSVLLSGEQGSGKTMATQLLCYQAAKRGSLVVDVDPKPDHNLEGALPGLVEVIELSGADQYRGMLDPLVVAPEGMREDLASSYLMDLLPSAPPQWETQVRKAVRGVLSTGKYPTCVQVLEALGASANSDARAAGDALEVWSASGLGRLGFAETHPSTQDKAVLPVTTIKADALHLPEPGVEALDQQERIGVATLKLVIAYAMRLVAQDRTRHKIVALDEAWFLIASSSGRRFIDKLNRTLRAMNGTLLIASQSVQDVGDIERLIGMRLDFTRRGHCMLRDLDGRVASVQVDPVDPWLLYIFDTSPGARVAA